MVPQISMTCPPSSLSNKRSVPCQKPLPGLGWEWNGASSAYDIGGADPLTRLGQTLENLCV